MIKNRKGGTALIMLVLALGTSGSAKAKDTTGMTTQERSDQRFLVEAAMGNLAEVQLGQLALDRGQSQDVKSFAQRLKDDHGKSHDQLKSLTAEQNVTMPSKVDEKHTRVFTKLSRVSAREFDKTFMDEMVKDHEADVREFEQEAAEAQEPSIKAWARDTLPTLREHLQSARDISSRLEQSGKT